MPLSARWRHVLIQALLMAAGIQILVDLLGGPEPLGVAILPIGFISFALDLKGEADRRTRRWTWAFVVVGLLGLAGNILVLVSE